MQPWNLKVKKIGRGYFFIALICCLFLTGTGELLTIMTPHSEKVVDVSVDEQNSTVINTRTVNHEGRWVFFMILYDFFVVLRWLYLISLIIKRYHDCIWRILTAGFAEQNGRNAKLNGRITFDY